MGSLHLGLASFLCCARTPTSHPQLRSCTALLLPRASKGPLRCRSWTFESFPITGHHVGYAEFLPPLRATVHNNHMISSSPPSNIHRRTLPTCPSFRPRSSRLTKKLRSCAVPFVFSCQAPCQASFRPVPLGFKLGLPFGRLRFFFPFFKKIQQWVSDHHHHHHHHHYHHHQHHHHHHHHHEQQQRRQQQQQHQHHHDISW